MSPIWVGGWSVWLLGGGWSDAGSVGWVGGRTPLENMGGFIGRKIGVGAWSDATLQYGCDV